MKRSVLLPIAAFGLVFVTVLDNNSSHEVYAAATWRSWSGYSGGSSLLSPVTSAGYTGTGSWAVNQVHVDVLNSASYSGYRMLYVYLQPNHEASHVDGTWASATRYAIEETLDGRTKARLETVDCRSDSCAARVAYDSEADALDDAMALVVADYGVPCNKRFWVEGPTVELWLYGCE
ncbi:MAG: hypothetical protein RIT81_01965 [Deltaproteobacteria bacterium]